MYKKLLIASLLTAVSFSSLAIKIDPVAMFGNAVPDDVLSQDIQDVGAFQDTAEITCNTDYDKGSDSFNQCIAGREAVFKIKNTQTTVYKLCNQFHSGTDMVATCLTEWTNKSNWISSSKMSNDENLLIRGCVKRGGTDTKAVLRCIQEASNI